MSMNPPSKSISFTPTMYLDEVLLVEILKRVPVKTLIQFRCVCKSWNSLISSPFFITHHLISFTKPNDNSKNSSFLLFSVNKDIPLSLSYAFYNPNPNPNQDHPPRFHTSPIQSQSNTYKVIGVVHGIVCLSHEFTLSTTNTFNTYLWNPAMHKYIHVPRSSSFRRVNKSKSFDLSHDIGFGFDGGKNEFKVVRYWYPTCNYDGFATSNPKFEVFSTLDLKWRSVVSDHIQSFALESKCGFFKNGVIHWVVRRYIGRGGTVLSCLMFDCEREEFKFKALPREMNRVLGNSMQFFSYRGMISLSVITRVSELLEVWVMEEYRVPRSWKKLSNDYENFVNVEESGVYRLSQSQASKMIDLRVFKGSHYPLNGHIFHPSFFFMDAKSQAKSYAYHQ